ncbi:uncharacterized protein LOC126748868 isoform X2 [Anthonomus grandis grandis]|uniref:uncharacterized protein LOC126748868 isoform X2 n=1 Tax=Anthonomus grandis grandis TaxID=2921223 RepID=UPI0021655833|nr:uncharacterized protein LOC126748868 isoform X2 [Anthonomus grandis grandis]
MEISWKCFHFCFLVFFVGFCKGFPINLEDSNTGHTQFLTGVAAVLITVGSIILAGCLCCQKRKGFEEFHNSPVLASTVPNSDPGHTNPLANGEFTIFTPLSVPTRYNNNVFLANDQVIRATADDYICGDIDVSLWFSGQEKDFPRSKLKYIRELGNGSFGKVVEGAAQNLDPDRPWTPVVVRILNAASSSTERLLYLNDALFYLAPAHPNLLQLRGRCLSTVPLLLLQESCSGGDLKARLRAKGTEENGLMWCCQLTSALKHLHENGFVHPDLAARNCLLTDSLMLKLGDYSLGSTNYPDDYYKGGEPLIPVRWRAPESLDCTPTTIQPKKLTTEANVWSLGVTLWEICENGAQPYGHLDDDEVISRVFGTERLRLDGPTTPNMYSDYIFRLMKLCWTNIDSRPKVAQIDLMLIDLLQVHKHTHGSQEADFEARWEQFKPNTIVKTDNHSVSIDVDALKTASNLNAVPKPNIQLKLGIFKEPETLRQTDSLTDSMIFRQGSSGSDTEEENWMRKVERGAYSEKVRLKSRSVADLMVLTHVDYSESESETPMPSIDYKINRPVKKSNLESASLNFSSEGNLLSLEDTFEQELKKLQVERRDSLLFVPDNKSQNNSNLSLLQELNSPTEIKPMNQIYNIFNMTFASGSKLNELIGEDGRAFSRQDSENRSDLGYATLHNSERNSDFGSVDGEQLLMEDPNSIVKTEIEQKLRNCEFSPKFSESESPKKQQNLPDILASLDQEHHTQVNVDLLEPQMSSNLDHDRQTIVPKLSDLVINNYSHDSNETLAPKESQLVPDLSVNEPFKESFVPEIRQEFIKGPSIMESLRSSAKGSASDDDLEEIDCAGHATPEEIHCIETINQFLIEERKWALLDSPLSSPHVARQNKTFCSNETLDPELKKPKEGNETVFVEEPKNGEEFSQNCIAKADLETFLIEERKSSLIDTLSDLSSFKSNELNKRIYESLKVEDLSDEPNHINERVSEAFDINSFLNAERLNALEDIFKTPLANIKLDISLKSDSTTTSNQNLDNEQNVSSEHKRKLSFDLREARPETPDKKARVQFDLSESQEETMPNSLTHSSVFTSTPFRKKQELSISNNTEAYSSLNLFDAQPEGNEEFFSSNFVPVETKQLNYSLETWDNFLGKSFDNSRGENAENMFDSFTSEPQSLLFLENECARPSEGTCVKEPRADGTFVKEEVGNGTLVKNGTFVMDEKKDGTFVMDDRKNSTFVMENPKNIDGAASEGHFESGGGWFLHPQSGNSNLSGDIEPQPGNSKGTYVGFGMNDEIMTAIRNELLEKLPHAQGAAQENITEDEEWKQTERNEIMLTYNIHNPPLSPIPEETSFEIENEDQLRTSTGENTPKLVSESEDSDWSDQDPDDIPMPSSHTNEKILEQDITTPSQSSCCSNDTLFNFDDIANNDQKDENQTFTNVGTQKSSDVTVRNAENSEGSSNDTLQESNLVGTSLDPVSLEEFLTSERNHTSSACNSLSFGVKVVAPLPSPDDKPWKTLQNCLLTYDKIKKPLPLDNLEETSSDLTKLEDSQSESLNGTDNQNIDLINNDENKIKVPAYENIDAASSELITYENLGLATYENVSQPEKMTHHPYENIVVPETYENLKSTTHSYENISAVDKTASQPYENILIPDKYENVGSITHPYENVLAVEKPLLKTFEPYGNILDEPNRYENPDKPLPVSNLYDDVAEPEQKSPLNLYDEVDIENTYDYTNIEDFKGPRHISIDDKETNEYITSIDHDEHDKDMFGVLTDIRFSGPIDNQLMSTSFSESNDIDEQDWDSGSDTRSSSSGEFIWKLEDVKPMEEIIEETTESDVSSNSSDEEKDNLEFVPSAWDKFATPTKSALRSPEKTLERPEMKKKPKGVWFKKQKYHCVYEYPREPESPILQSQDLWKPPVDLATFTGASNHSEEEFIVPPSSKLIDPNNLICSQFFPGASAWIENVTPDSGLEDSTPLSESTDLPRVTAKEVLPLKKLAAVVVSKSKEVKKSSKESLGGLRHTRNRLKLDLPPSPSAFTSNKTFTVEPFCEPVILREKPTFSTFGKSRFLVQQVDTSTDNSSRENKNVCFDVIPYKPINIVPMEPNVQYEPLKKDFGEVVPAFSNKKELFTKGEASLLDSADEDSGIESSSLDRKLANKESD